MPSLIESNRRVLARWVRAFLIVCFSGLLLDFFVLDQFKVSGHVVDVGTSAPIPNAQILITVRGDRPFLPWPHSRRRNSVCLHSYETVSDDRGRFYLNRTAWNSLFINKRITIAVLSDDHVSDSSVADITPSIFAVPSEISLSLIQASAMRVPYHGESVANFERSRSETYASLQRIMQRARSCGEAQIAFSQRVLHRMGEIALSEEERSLTLAYCRELSSWVPTLQCDSSFFKSKPVKE